MTGVEAVSNGVVSFKRPVVKEAHVTLTVICIVVGLLLAGIATVAHADGLAAMNQTQPDDQSVLGQLAAAVSSTTSQWPAFSRFCAYRPTPVWSGFHASAGSWLQTAFCHGPLQWRTVVLCSRSALPCSP